MNLSAYLHPQQNAPPRENPSGSTGAYLRCYLLLRILVGCVGILLPIVLLVGDWIFLAGPFAVRGSLSAYYHSGMRDVFVGSLCAVAVFLVTYKVFERSLDNTLSILAGAAALGVALLPTDRPGDVSSPQTPLQERLGETTVASFHYISAVTFIVSLGIISYYFGKREGKRDEAKRLGTDVERRSTRFWKIFHWACAGAIAAAIVYIAVSNMLGWLPNRYSLLIGECVAVIAFGLSWLFKGLERDMLKKLKEEHAEAPSLTT